MTSFKNRSDKKELLDGDAIPFKDIRQNMRELQLINKHLGGHDITLDGIVALIGKGLALNNTYSILEIGCGGGDNLKAIANWAAYIKLPVQLTGVDINKECIQYAESRYANTVSFIHADYRTLHLVEKPDIIFSSLFCHHFTNEELVTQLQWMKENASIGFFINDLHRHPAAYYAIRILTAIFSRSYLVKNDAPLSVKRGFKRQDWEKILWEANILNYTCSWRWAFRWLITCTTYDSR